MSDPAIEGIVHFIDDTKSYGQKGFRKRLVVLEQDSGRFTNYIPIDFTNDDCDAVDELNQGDRIEVTYRLNGRKWQRDSKSEVKYFLNAEAVRFKVTQSKGEGSVGDASSSVNDSFAEAAGDDDDEVPF